MNQTSIKIIANKKLALTDAEYRLYQDICQAYTRPNLKGEELFVGLFESDDRGIITFICPPSGRYTSMEIFCFICALFNHQHTRLMYEELHTFLAAAQEKVNALTAPK